jgi:hypothetical protein
VVLVADLQPQARSILFVQPITVKTTPAGLELALPSKEVVTTERRMSRSATRTATRC